MSNSGPAVETVNDQMEYQLANNWPQLPAGFILGNPTGIDINKDQHLVVFHRANRTWPVFGGMPKSFIAANTILELDKETGQLIRSWGANLFVMPHGLTIDEDDNVWVTDVGLHQVFKFNKNGQLLMKLGEAGVPRNDRTHFNKPTDVAVAADGSFYVSDGYGNSRIIKFSGTGEYLMEWGRKGSAEGEFNIPHAIDIDEAGKVYVADRENSRVQVFDANGKFLTVWKNEQLGKLYSVVYDKTRKRILSVDYLTKLGIFPQGSNVILFDLSGQSVKQFGRTGSYHGPVCRYHDLAIDKDGNIYVQDILGNRIQKFKKLIR